MFNKLPKHIRMLSSCSVDKFKSQLHKHLKNISDLPYQPGYNNSLDGGFFLMEVTTRMPWLPIRCNRTRSSKSSKSNR